jgi:DNA-directed RNA polymerase subunit RPC12/RpoP
MEPAVLSPAGPGGGPSLAEVLRAALAVHCGRPVLSPHQARVVGAVVACRTPALGGHRYRCAACGAEHFVPHSCRNRHCPQCQGAAAFDWLARQEAALLPVPYFHLVFTLPHALNPLIQQNREALYSLLFATVSQTILSFAERRFGVRIGVTAVLHTWSQTLLDHYHLHCVVSGGGLSADARRWVSAPSHYLFPVTAMARVFTGKFCAGMRQLFAARKLQFHGELTQLSVGSDFHRLLTRACRHRWNVYAKRPFAGPSQVLAYLSRYTHRVALSPRRLQHLDTASGTVRFDYKDYADGARHKSMKLELGEFLRRFVLHVLPPRFVRIRHYGLLANRGREERLALARTLLPVKPTLSQLPPDGSSPAHTTPGTETPGPVCPHCGHRALVLMEIVSPRRAPPVAFQDSS